MSQIRSVLQGAKLTVAVVLVAAVAACDGGVLDVQDPDNITPPEALTPGNLETEFAGAVGDFRNALDNHVLYSGLLTDEFVLGGTFPTRRRVDFRTSLADNGSVHDDVWLVQARSILEADNLIAGLEQVLADENDDFDLGLVRENLVFTRVLAGFQRIYFAEDHCQTILGGEREGESEGSPLTAEQRMQEAIGVLSDAVSLAQTTGQTELLNAARLGQARAHMFLGNFSDAANLAADVPTEHVFQIEFSTNQIAEENDVFQFTWDFNEALRWTVGNGEDASRANEQFGRFELASGTIGEGTFDEWVSQGLIMPADHPNNSLQAFGAPDRPVSAQTLYGARNGDRGDPLGESPINVSTGWHARMIEAEVELRNGNPGTAEMIVNPLLNDPDQALNPLLDVEPSLAEAPGPNDYISEQMGAFEEVDFVAGELEQNLAKLARARSAGLWLSGTRQGFFRRLHPKSGGPVDLYPDKSGTAFSFSEDISMPVTEDEVDNNANIGSSCPSGLP